VELNLGLIELMTYVLSAMFLCIVFGVENLVFIVIY
jgi:hypothetical protein